MATGSRKEEMHARYLVWETSGAADSEPPDTGLALPLSLSSRALLLAVAMAFYSSLEWRGRRTRAVEVNVLPLSVPAVPYPSLL